MITEDTDPDTDAFLSLGRVSFTWPRKGSPRTHVGLIERSEEQRIFACNDAKDARTAKIYRNACEWTEEIMRIAEGQKLPVKPWRKKNQKKKKKNKKKKWPPKTNADSEWDRNFWSSGQEQQEPAIDSLFDSLFDEQVGPTFGMPFAESMVGGVPAEEEEWNNPPPPLPSVEYLDVVQFSPRPQRRRRTTSRCSLPPFFIPSDFQIESKEGPTQDEHDDDADAEQEKDEAISRPVGDRYNRKPLFPQSTVYIETDATGVDEDPGSRFY